MAAQRTTAGSALLTGTLLAAVLAIITGILGMHVMTGTHSAHSAAAVPADAPVMATRVLATSGHPSGHASHQQSASSGAAALEELPASLGAASPAQCSCSGNCPSEHSMTAACIPSAAAGVLAAPVPAEAPRSQLLRRLPPLWPGVCGPTVPAVLHRVNCPSAEHRRYPPGQGPAALPCDRNPTPVFPARL